MAEENKEISLAAPAAEVAKNPILDEIATVGNRDITYGFIGNILLNPDTVLQTEGGGSSFAIQLYEQLELDDHVYAEIQKRKNTVSSKEWDITPASDTPIDIQIAEFVQQQLSALPFGSVIKSLLDAKMKGFAVGEVLWQVKKDGSIGIKEILGRDQRRFAFALDRSLRLLTPQNMIEGEAVPERKFVVLSSGSKVSNPYGSGLGARVYWPVWFKKNGIRFWAIFLEKFGSPTTVGKYPPGTPKAQQDALLQAIEAIQQETAVKIPDNMIIDLLEAQRTGSTESYQQFQNYWNKAISIVIVGQTLTTDVGSSGSRALGQVHNEVRLDLVKDDADELAECLNSQLVRWLVDFNFPNVDVYPKFWIQTDAEKDLNTLAQRDDRLVRLGLKIPESYFYQAYSIPKPLPNEPLVIPMGKGQPAGGDGQPPGGEGGSFAEGDLRFTPPQRKIEDLVDHSLLRAAAAMVDLEAPIRKMIREAKSLEELKRGIELAYTDMDTRDLEAIVGQALFAADLWGRAVAEGEVS